MTKICENCDKVYPDDMTRCPCCNIRIIKLDKDIIRHYVREEIERI